MLRELKKFSRRSQDGERDDHEGTDAMDGLKVLKNMSRMRAVKSNFRKRPRRIVRLARSHRRR